MTRETVRTAIEHVGLALREPAEFAEAWNAGRAAYPWTVWGALLAGVLVTSQLSGLEGMALKQAPTQAQSAVDPLSFRDVMPLCFLTNQRMDNKNLLLGDAEHMGIALVHEPKTEFKTFWTLVVGSSL